MRARERLHVVNRGAIACSAIACSAIAAEQGKTGAQGPNLDIHHVGMNAQPQIAGQRPGGGGPRHQGRPIRIPVHLEGHLSSPPTYTLMAMLPRPEGANTDPGTASVRAAEKRTRPHVKVGESSPPSKLQGSHAGATCHSNQNDMRQSWVGTSTMIWWTW